MGLHIQWYRDDVGGLRAGENFRCPPDDYDFSCMVLLEGEVAELVCGIADKDKLFNIVGYRIPLAYALKKKNIKYVKYDRYKNGQLIKHNVIEI